jgi:hypothetical protein
MIYTLWVLKIYKKGGLLVSSNNEIPGVSTLGTSFFHKLWITLL